MSVFLPALLQDTACCIHFALRTTVARKALVTSGTSGVRPVIVNERRLFPLRTVTHIHKAVTDVNICCKLSQK